MRNAINNMVGLHMPRAKIVEEKIAEKGMLFSALYLGTKNASLILLSEGDDRLGTLAVAIPQAPKMVGPPLSSILLGDRNVTIARVLAERLAAKMNKIALVSVFIKTVDELEAGPVLLKLVEKTLKRGEVEA